MVSSHASTVQATLSEPQGICAPATQPLGVGPLGLQVSWPLQSRPSLHGALLGVNTQPCACSLQASPVQERLSLQATAMPASQPIPGVQTSTPLQKTPSAQ